MNILLFLFQFDMIDQFFAVRGNRKLMFFYQEPVVSLIFLLKQDFNLDYLLRWTFDLYVCFVCVPYCS